MSGLRKFFIGASVAFAAVTCVPACAQADGLLSHLKIDPCAMLSATDISTAIGSAVRRETTANASECIWAVAAHAPSGVRQVALTLSVANAMRQGACRGLSCVGMLSSVASLFPGLDGVSGTASTIANVVEIAGLGDKAYWGGGALTVLKASTAMKVQVDGPDSVAALQLSKLLAGNALGHLAPQQHDGPDSAGGAQQHDGPDSMGGALQHLSKILGGNVLGHVAPQPHDKPESRGAHLTPQQQTPSASCTPQWTSDGVWRIRVARLAALSDRAGRPSYAVTLDVQNASGEPTSMVRSGVEQSTSLVNADGTTLTADDASSEDWRQSYFRDVAPGGGFTATVSYPSASGKSIAKPSAWVLRVDPSRAFKGSPHYIAPDPSLRVDLACQ